MAVFWPEALQALCLPKCPFAIARSALGVKASEVKVTERLIAVQASWPKRVDPKVLHSFLVQIC